MTGSEEGSKWYQGNAVFSSLNISLIKQSILLTVLRLLKIVSSSVWNHKKVEYVIFLQIYQKGDYGSLAWFWENFEVNLNEPFHT